MAKKPKKRNKAYSGSNAARRQPTVTRIEAENRSPLMEWWHAKRKIVKPVAIAIGVLLIFIWLIIVIIQTFAK